MSALIRIISRNGPHMSLVYINVLLLSNVVLCALIVIFTFWMILLDLNQPDESPTW